MQHTLPLKENLVKTISPEEIRSIRIAKNYAFYYEELLGPLREAGCHDLARAAESVIARATKP